MHTYYKNSVLPPLLYKTSSRISSFRVANKDILWITKSIDSSKSHGYDNNSVKSVQIQSFSGPYFPAFGLNTERCRACLAITGRIKGTSREQLFYESDLHWLVKRRWRSKLVNRLLLGYHYCYLDFSSQENNN